VASFSTIDNSDVTLTGLYEPAVSNNINFVPFSKLTCLKLNPFVLTFLPEGKFAWVIEFKIKVFPLSYNPTTATTAPSQA
jgi:hypothetical protein